VIYNPDCGSITSATVTITADGVDEPLSKTSVYIRYTLNRQTYGPVLTAFHGSDFQARVGPFKDTVDGTITFDIYAIDSAGLESAHYTRLSIAYVGSCPIG
jgi:hypothetical protein